VRGESRGKKGLKGNSADKLCHIRSVAYLVKLVMLNKHPIPGGGAYRDCYRDPENKDGYWAG